jgi:hypothetical protein
MAPSLAAAPASFSPLASRRRASGQVLASCLGNLFSVCVFLCEERPWLKIRCSWICELWRSNMSLGGLVGYVPLLPVILRDDFLVRLDSSWPNAVRNSTMFLLCFVGADLGSVAWHSLFWEICVRLVLAGHRWAWISAGFARLSDESKKFLWFELGPVQLELPFWLVWKTLNCSSNKAML